MSGPPRDLPRGDYDQIVEQIVLLAVAAAAAAVAILMVAMLP